MFLGYSVHAEIPQGVKAMRKCSKCRQVKELSEFYKNKWNKTGVHIYCIPCWKEYKVSKNHTEYFREYKKRRKLVDVQYRISEQLRNRFGIAVKKGVKVGSAIRNLGCSVEELKEYLQSKFSKGMDWENYGKWHIDHIKPLSKFNLSDQNQVAVACHYTNLQPLWATENFRKGNN